MTAPEVFLSRLPRESAVLVTVHASLGSVPREAGAWMAVFTQDAVGTIGGGHLEFQALAQARRHLAGSPADAIVHYALGPGLGQCCGGALQLKFETVSVVDIKDLAVRLQPLRTPVALFGGGHVHMAAQHA